jgi:drug/metabolite transporter (DMT)-like permease
MGVMQMTTLTVSGLTLPFLPLPASASWPWLLAGAGLHCGYRILLVRAYGYGELGQMYPIARGSSPILVTLGSAAIVGEYPRPLSALGIFLIAGGILGLRKTSSHTLSASAMLIAVATGCFTASYTIADGIGARVSGDPIAFIMWLFFISGIGTVIWSCFYDRKRALRLDRTETLKSIGGGLVSMAAYGAVIFASTLGELGATSALRETSVVFAALIGRFFLHESLTSSRTLACVVVASGGACITLF